MLNLGSLIPISTLIFSETTESTDLVRAGLQSTGIVNQLEFTSSLDVLASIGFYNPDLIVMIKASADKDLINQIGETMRHNPRPIIVFVQNDPAKFARDAIRKGVSSFVVDGLTPSRIPSLIEVALERFKLTEALANELQKSKDTLAARKIIEQAKGLLMQSRGMTEQEAYRALRTLAMQKGKPIKDIADIVIGMSDVLS